MSLGVLWLCSHDCTVFTVTPKNRAKMLWLAPNSLRTFLTEAASYCVGWKSKTIGCWPSPVLMARAKCLRSPIDRRVWKRPQVSFLNLAQRL